MREATRRKLERELLRQRLRWVFYGLAALAVVVAGMLFTNLDATVDDQRLAGTVENVDRFVSSRGRTEGWRVGVELTDGRHVVVLAGKQREVHTGESIEVTEHHHHTGRTTFTLR
jgi:hypothetical protein